jgi:hypothetical protein
MNQEAAIKFAPLLFVVFRVVSEPLNYGSVLWLVNMVLLAHSLYSS